MEENKKALLSISHQLGILTNRCCYFAESCQEKLTAFSPLPSLLQDWTGTLFMLLLRKLPSARTQRAVRPYSRRQPGDNTAPGARAQLPAQEQGTGWYPAWIYVSPQEPADPAQETLLTQSRDWLAEESAGMGKLGNEHSQERDVGISRKKPDSRSG